MLDLYGKVLARKPVPADETNPLVTVLKLSGIARVADGTLQVRNRIYREVFDRHWILANLPNAEIRRQRAALRRGPLPAGLDR